MGTNLHDAQRFMGLAQEWHSKSLIWVCTSAENGKDAAFYSHVGKLDTFHHSSFLAGGDVISAGEWIVEKGKLRKISANSGHYRPTLDSLHRAVLLMNGAWQDDTVVLLWSPKNDRWEEVPVQRFKTDPSGGGQWKSHPAA
jgi:hypothetical protein